MIFQEFFHEKFAIFRKSTSGPDELPADLCRELSLLLLQLRELLREGLQVVLDVLLLAVRLHY